MNALFGMILGLLMTPPVYLLASWLLTDPRALPRTGPTFVLLTSACTITGIAITALAGVAVDHVPDVLLVGESASTALISVIITAIAYTLFAFAVVAAATVDVAERRIPNRITYPLIVVGVVGLPWLTQPVTWWSLLTPLAGALASAAFALINALVADQGLGDVKLAAAIGAWTAHLGLAIWVTGVVISQLLMVAAVAATRVHRRRVGLPPDLTPLGPSLAGGAVLAVAVAALQISG